MMHRLFGTLGAFALLTLGPALAHAQQVACVGAVSSFALSSSGSLLVEYGATPLHAICNLTLAYNGIEKDMCKSWLSVIQTAKVTGNPVKFYYESTVAGNPASCAAFSYGQSATPYYLEVL